MFATSATLMSRRDVPCDGCNCLQTIVLGPGDVTIITSPEFRRNYPNGATCSWRIKSTSGTLSLSLPKFDLKSANDCSRDFLQVAGPIKEHGKVKLCGNKVPEDTSFDSKYQTLTLKFVSNGKRRKSGFKAKITAN